MILLPRQFSRQPQGPVDINWGNPLTRGLTDCIDFRSPIARNILPIGKQPASQGSSVVSSVGSGGLGLSFPGGTASTASRLTIGGNSDYTSTSQSWVIVCSVNAANGFGNVIIEKSSSDSSKEGFTLLYSSTFADLVLKNPSGTGVEALIYTDLRNSRAVVIGFSFNTSNHRLAINGTLSDDATPPSGFSVTSSFPLIFGSHVDTFWNNFDGKIYAAFGWVGTTLNRSQLSLVTQNPWQLLKKQSLKLFSAPAPSAQTLSPSLYTNSNTFYSATVSPGAVTLEPSLFTNTNTFYSSTVSPGAVNLSPSLFTNDNTFYSAFVTLGGVVLQPSLYTNDQTFYSPTVTQTGVTIYEFQSLSRGVGRGIARGIA